MAEQNEARTAAADLKRTYDVLEKTYATAPALSTMDRELATVAALAAIGSKGSSQLPAHIQAALDAGATRQTIVEGLATISQASGTPTAVNGIAVAAKVFIERDEKGLGTDAERVWIEGDAPGGTPQERWDRSQQTISEVYPAGPTDETYTAISARRLVKKSSRSCLPPGLLSSRPGAGLRRRGDDRLPCDLGQRLAGA
ncbi:carboxymuconolactone decarboxylase family protein [Streptomyces sp. NPDC052309]|uniref:carboxymuconolactone decarboxylase family protein n=1 Tax=Streptomyces sp. NPDC052309 TaxID=3155421 RepID=UPI003434BAF8